VKFIILTTPRTGSTLLYNVLDGHPMVRCYGEILHNEEYMRDRECKKYDKQMGELYDTDKTLYLKTFHCHPDYPTVGFKVMYSHLASEVVEYLQNTPISIIHLTRNLFEAYVSRKRSLKYKIWHIPVASNKALPDEQLTISPQECEKYFNDTTELMEKYKSLLGKDTFSLDYSQLSTKFVQTIKAIYNFLHLPDHYPIATSKKSENKTMKQRVKNYDEIKDYFKDTCYTKLF
jgi:LPS sulfotransferase NodH